MILKWTYIVSSIHCWIIYSVFRKINSIVVYAVGASWRNFARVHDCMYLINWPELGCFFTPYIPVSCVHQPLHLISMTMQPTAVEIANKVMANLTRNTNIFHWVYLRHESSKFQHVWWAWHLYIHSHSTLGIPGGEHRRCRRKSSHEERKATITIMKFFFWNEATPQGCSSGGKHWNGISSRWGNFAA
jgi:hypothetical protein